MNLEIYKKLVVEIVLVVTLVIAIAIATLVIATVIIIVIMTGSHEKEQISDDRHRPMRNNFIMESILADSL